MQALVAELCEEAGLASSEMEMAYQRPSGAWGTVTRSVPLETLKKAPALRLTPQLRPTVAS